MKAIQVRYRVQKEYIEQNKTNIKSVMKALKTNPIPGMKYATFTVDDGQTFVHINMAKDDETMSKLSTVPEFIEFRQQLKASNPIHPPSSTQLDLVDAGFDL